MDLIGYQNECLQGIDDISALNDQQVYFILIGELYHIVRVLHLVEARKSALVGSDPDIFPFFFVKHCWGWDNLLTVETRHGACYRSRGDPVKYVEKMTPSCKLSNKLCGADSTASGLNHRELVY
jgi:hypothetical protein